jgi:hypothetical protein
VKFGETLFGKFPFSGISREASASPATGSAIYHKKEQERILEEAFYLEAGTAAGVPPEKHNPAA